MKCKVPSAVVRVLLFLLGAWSCIATIGVANAATICVGPFCLVELTFDEVSFGDAAQIDPLPPTTYQDYGVLFKDFLWGKDFTRSIRRRPAIDIWPLGQDPTVEFLRPTPFVEFQYWTVDDVWQIQVIAFNARNAEVGSFIDFGLWSDGGGTGRIVGRSSITYR